MRFVDAVVNGTVAMVDSVEYTSFGAIYGQGHDRPEQYAALQKLYLATGQEYLSALYQQGGSKVLHWSQS